MRLTTIYVPTGGGSVPEVWSGERSIRFSKSMHHVQVLLMPLKDGYRAAVSELGYLDSYDLKGFRLRMLSAVARGLGSDDFKVEFTLSKDLKALFQSCARCGGTARIDVDGVFAQYMANVYDSVDFSQRGSSTCPDCQGLGVDIPDF